MNAEDMIDPRDPIDRTEIGRKPSADQALLDAINEVDAASKKITFYSLEPAEGEPGVANMMVRSVAAACAKCGTPATPDTVCLCYGPKCVGCKKCCETRKAQMDAEKNESDPFDGGCAHDCADRGTDAPIDPYDKQVDELARCWPKGALEDSIMEMPRLLGHYQAAYEESKRHKAAAAKAEQRCADIDACIKYIEKNKSVPTWAYNVTDTYR